MATFRKYTDKRGNVSWQVQVRKKDVHESKTFKTQADAKRWAAEIESEISRGVFVSRAEAERTTLNDVCERYRQEVLPGLKGAKPDNSRLKNIQERLGHLSLAAISSTILSQFRDARLREVSRQTTIHELNLINRVLKTCMVDWGIALPTGLPVVRKPEKPRGRDRRVEQDEIEAICKASESQELASIIVVAVETAMRRGEIAEARRDDLDLRKRTLRLHDTKNGESRVVPLSTRAIDVLNRLQVRLDGKIFGMRPDSITQAFERAVVRARMACEAEIKQPAAGWLKDVRFHDLRHEGTSRLADRVSNLVELASVTGHKDLQMLKRYYHPRAEDLAKKLG